MRAMLAVTLLLTGCLDQIIQVRSEPPGAECFIDGQRIGATPCETKFTWYGDHEIVLVKPGCRSVKKLEPVSMPWFEYFPIDFFSDLLVPWTVHDHHIFQYTLEPAQVEENTRDVQERAREMRKKLER